MILFLISIVFAILLESTITTLPLTLVMLLFLAVSRRSNDVFLVAFLSGLALDILSFGTIGLSSLYFVSMILFVYLYQRRFEIETINFLMLFSFLGSLIYLLLEGIRFAFFQSIIITMVVVASYYIHRRFNKKIPKYA